MLFCHKDMDNTTTTTTATTTMNKDGQQQQQQQQVGSGNYHYDDEELLSSVPPHLECYFRTGQVEDVANAESPDGVGDGGGEGHGDGAYSQFEAKTTVQGRAMLAQEEGKKSSFLLTHLTTTSPSPSSTSADQSNAGNKLLHSIGPCPSHIVVEYKPSWSLSSSKQQQQQSATQQRDTTTSPVPFFLGGVQLVSSAKDAVVYWTGLDGKEMYLMTSKGIKFRGTLPRALTDIDPSMKNREWFKSICVIPGGPRPILRLRISLKNVRPKDSKFADVLSMKLTARLTEQPPTSPTLSQSQVQTQNSSQPRPSTQGGHLVSSRSTTTSKTPSTSASHSPIGPIAAVASVSSSTSTSIPVVPVPVPQLQEHKRPQAQQQQQQQQSRGEPPITQSDLDAAMAAMSFMSRSMEKAVCERLEKHTTSCVSSVEREVSALKSIIMAQQQQLIETQKILRQQQILLDRQSNQIRDMRLHQEDIRLCVQAVQADMSIVKCNSQLQHNQLHLSSQPSHRQPPIKTTAKKELASETDNGHNEEPREHKKQSIAINLGGADAFGARESKPDMHQQQQHHHQQQVFDDEKNSNAFEVTVRNDERNIGNNISMENGNTGDGSIDRKVVLEDDDDDDELGQILDGSIEYSNQEDTQLPLGYNTGEMLKVEDVDHEKNGIFVDKNGSQDGNDGEEEDDGDDDDDEYDGDGNDTAFMSIMTESVFLNALDKKPDPPLPSDPIVRFPPERSATLYHDNKYKAPVSNELHHNNEVPPSIGAQHGYDIQHVDEMLPSESALQRFGGSGVKEAEHSEDCADDDEDEIHPNIEVTLWEDDLTSGKKLDSNDTIDSEAISEEGESGGSDEGREIAPYDTSGDSRGAAGDAKPETTMEGADEILESESEGAGPSLNTNVKAVDCSFASQLSCAPTSSAPTSSEELS